MRRIHFLNVKNGDCSILQHTSGHVSVIDVCNAGPRKLLSEAILKSSAADEAGLLGNFNQRKYPENPISYMKDRGISSVFRFIVTHPDMDHIDGIKALFAEFSPANLWDTENTCEKEFGPGDNGGYREEDWLFYKTLRDNNPQSDPKRLTLHAGARGIYYNKTDESAGSGGGDGLFILSPTPDLVTKANACEDFNDCSYVILYRAAGENGNVHKVLFAGDSHDATWEHILKNHEADVSDVDVLIAPHHGRHSDREWDFLDVVNPAITLFGNAGSEHLAYSAWNGRGLPLITNNQAGTIIIDVDSDPMAIYVSCEKFARSRNPGTFHSNACGGYFLQQVIRKKKAVAV